MKRLICTLALSSLLFGCMSVGRDYTCYVDPYIGSGGHGHVFVGANVPHGMVQVGPQNINKGWDWCSGYHYSDSIVIGFSHTHLSGTGASDHGDLILMPFSGDRSVRPGTQDNIEGTTSSYYSHANEEVAPGYYALTMDNGIRAEMTATERAAIHRYTYVDRTDCNRLLINLADGNGDKTVEAMLRKIDDYTVEGFRRSKGWSQSIVYFTLKADHPIANTCLYDGDRIVSGEALESPGARCVLSFQENPQEIKVKVGVSSVSCANAALNLNTEIPDWDLDRICRQAHHKWNDKLSKIEIETSDEAAKTVFYTALYHYHFAPTIYCDVNGEYRGYDGKIHMATNWNNYSTFSLWDTYRTWHPLLTILDPGMVPDLVNSMLSTYDELGHLPIWTLNGFETFSMRGYSAVPVIADACLKGIEGFDRIRALDAMVVSSTDPGKRAYVDDLEYMERRDEAVGYGSGISYLSAEGVIPFDKIFHATSKALEYAVDDWGIAQVAKQLGRKDLYDEYLKRSLNYKLYFDAESGFIRPKDSQGNWLSPYDPFYSVYSTGYFTEGNGWQYTFFVPQHPDGLVALFGSDEAFIQKLDEFFTVDGDLGENAPADVSGLIGMYAHGNEPSHHIAYLYPYAGAQWKTAEKVRYIQKHFYHANPDGVIGNEDCGQMSAWHIMSALGFYQVNPADGVLVFGSPQFDEVRIPLGNDKQLQIVARDNSDENIYVQRVVWNGQEHAQAYIRYEELMQGGTLEFIMGDTPNFTFGAAPENRPFTKL